MGRSAAWWRPDLDATGATKLAAETVGTVSDAITIRLDGEPVAQLRPKAAARRGKDGTVRARVYEPGKSATYKRACATQARSAFSGEPLTGPLAVELDLFFRCPVSDRRVRQPRRRRWHAKKPDADNVCKAVVDALTGIVWQDDAQICHLTIRKWIAAQDESPFALVVVSDVAEIFPQAADFSHGKSA